MSTCGGTAAIFIAHTRRSVQLSKRLSIAWRTRSRVARASVVVHVKRADASAFVVECMEFILDHHLVATRCGYWCLIFAHDGYQNVSVVVGNGGTKRNGDGYNIKRRRRCRFVAYVAGFPFALEKTSAVYHVIRY